MRNETSGHERARRGAEQREALSEVRALLDEQRAVKAELRRARRDAVTAARRAGRRAPAMSVEQRRAEIIKVALPLLVERGASVTTSQIATAAGIAEGTVFRAFRDKNELLAECMRAAMDSDEEIERIRTIDRSADLAGRLVQAVGHIADFQARLWSVMQALHAAGVHPEPGFGEKDHEPGEPPEALKRVIAAMEGLFETDRDQLAVAPALAAQILLGLAFTNRMGGRQEAITDLAQLVDLFLHGILRSPGGKDPQ